VRTQRDAQREPVAQDPGGVVLDRDLDLRARGLADEGQRAALEAVLHEAPARVRALDLERAAHGQLLEVERADDLHALAPDRAGRRVDPHARGSAAADREVLRRAQRVLHERDGDAVAEVQAREGAQADAEDHRQEGHDEEELDEGEPRPSPPAGPSVHASSYLAFSQFPMSSSVPNSPSRPAEISW
jgi:hypothetical protein